jgi:hypothetical protein
MKVVLLLSMGMLGFGTVTESHAFGPQQAKSRVEAKRENKQRQERKANLVAELKRGLSRFDVPLGDRDAGGDRGLSSLLRVAMEPDLKLIRAALEECAKPDLTEHRAYLGLLSEILFVAPKGELARLRPGNGGFSALDFVNGQLSIRYGWGWTGIYTHPVQKFDIMPKSRKRRNLDRFKGQM